MDITWGLPATLRRSKVVDSRGRRWDPGWGGEDVALSWSITRDISQLYNGKGIRGTTMAGTTKAWRQSAVEYQQEMCNNFGFVDWDVYEEHEAYVLKDKIRVLLGGLSSDENQEAEKHVEKICELIIKESTCLLEGSETQKAIYMVFVFVIGTNDGENLCSWPVFRVPRDTTGDNASFIDMDCRVYKNWNDFLESNKLPVREYCYPRDGKYECDFDGKAAVEFGRPPQAKTSKKFWNAVDAASTGVALGAGVLTIASFAFPIAAPLLLASNLAAGGVSAYTTVRSTTKLHDRRTHKQSIGLGDSEARNCYVSIVGGALGIGASAATSATVKMAQSGRAVGRITTSTVTALNGGALVMNGVGIVNGVHYLIEKRKNGQVTALDVAQLSASLLLFCHATVNFKTAQSIIEKTQNNVINSYENSLGSRWKKIMFRTAAKCTTKFYGRTAGKALVIRNIKHISNVDDYFTSLLPEDEVVSSSPEFLVSQSNIGQMRSLDYLESLLTVHEKLELKELLLNFTEPFRKIILGFCDHLFKAMEKTRGCEFMHIAEFVKKFVHHLTNLVFNGERLYVISVLRTKIRKVPPLEMTCYEYCLALLEELLSNPATLLTIYKLVESFFKVLLQRTNISREILPIDFVQLVSASSILLKMDKSYWELIIDFAKSIFDTLHLKKFSSLIQILKELLMRIQQTIFDMHKRYKCYSPEERMGDRYEDNFESDCMRALDSIYDEETRRSLINHIQGRNLDEISEESIPLRCMQSMYTIENPLIIRRQFWQKEQLNLLTEEEIHDVYKQILRSDYPLTNCSIKHDGLETLIIIDNTVVMIIKCDLENENIVAYACSPNPSINQNLTE